MQTTLNVPHPLRKALDLRTVGAALRGWAERIGIAAWRALEAAGHARAQHELRGLADQYEATQPELGKRLRAASLYDPCR
jgi:hypothetical protein